MWRAGATGGRLGRALAALAGALVVVLALAQLLLPRLAASRISSRVGRYGKVRSVSVSAWPAIELLWGDVGSVHVRAGALALQPSQVEPLLWEARGTASMRVSAERVTLGSLAITDAVLEKHGDELGAEGLVSEAAAKVALPAGLQVQLLGSSNGRVEVQASGSLFGVGASVDAVAGANDGKLVAHPVGFLVSALQLTLYSNPHVYIEGVAASVASGSPRSYRLSIWGRLR